MVTEATSAITSLRNMTFAYITERLMSGTLTSAKLVRIYMSRIADVDSDFNSTIELNPNALAEAEARDSMRASNCSISPHHGLPILLKDNIPTLDDMNTTCGSLALLGAKPKHEGAVVTALRRAGFIILMGEHGRMGRFSLN